MPEHECRKAPQAKNNVGMLHMIALAHDYIEVPIRAICAFCVQTRSAPYLDLCLKVRTNR
jgi:hypothetical protein